MIHGKMIDLVARRFQIMGDACRLRILQSLENRSMTVNEIVEAIKASQPNVSKHLQILFDAGLVGRERSGNSISYAIADPVVFKLCDLVCRSTSRQAAQVQRHAAGALRQKGVRE